DSDIGATIGLFRNLDDRGVNLVVAGAAADVAAHRGLDLLRLRLRSPGQQRAGGHQLAGLAIAALHDVLLQPGGLEGTADLRLGERLDGGDLLSAQRLDPERAGPGGDAVDMDGAGAAQAGPAAELGPDHTQLVPQDPEQRHIAGDVDLMFDAVDGDLEGHRLSP